MITPNASEAGMLCGMTVEPSRRRAVLEVAKRLVASGVEISIITLGKHGVCYATSELSGFVPAIRTGIIDPTGGGDALTAAVIFGLLNDMPLDEAIRLGVSAAALTLGYPGAVVPDLTLEKLYDALVI
jgi:pseudouridine kinase